MSQDYYYPSKHQTSQQSKLSAKKLSVKSSKKVHNSANADIQAGKALPKWNDYNINGPDSANLIKVVVIGESGAGKSNLIQRLTEDRFDSRSKSTIGIDFALYEFEEPAGVRRVGSKHEPMAPNVYKAQIWDTAGQERYRSSMTKIFYRDVAGALLVFDLTNRDHFFALNRWLDEIRSNVHNSADNPNPMPAPHQIPIVLVGNKVDQVDQYRAVQSAEGHEFARRHRLADYVETSAKTPLNVEKAFSSLFRHILIQRIRAGDEDEAEHGTMKSRSKAKFKQSRKSIGREGSIKLGYHNGTAQRNTRYQSPPPKQKKKCSC